MNEIDMAPSIQSVTDVDDKVTMCENGLSFDNINAKSDISPARTICSTSSSSSDQQPPTKSEKDHTSSSWKEKWSALIIRFVHVPLLRGLHWISGISARNPIRTIVLITSLSFLLFGIGFATNFTITTDEQVLWTPRKSFVREYSDWLINDANFGSNSARRYLASTDESRYFLVMIHSYGRNILGKVPARLVFNVSDTVFNLPRYNEICAVDGVPYTLLNGTEIITCGVSGIMRFWSFSSLLFDFTMINDEQVIEKLSSMTYSDGSAVNDHDIYGRLVRDKETGLLTSVESYFLVYQLPDTDEAQAAEKNYVKTILKINDEWQKNETTKDFRVEVIAPGSFAAEFTRGIYTDLPLVPFVLLMMSGFACLYFYRRDRVQSRSLLGIAAVVSIFLSIMSSYGVLFMIGVPFTTMTQLIPFLMFGIGLDDAFIIVDTYVRMDSSKSAEERISDAIQDCGFSITLTTITSTLAFGIGISSQIPAIRWVCMYASPTIAVVLLFQLTMFIACVVIDERRVQQGRLDICLCYKRQNRDETMTEPEISENSKDCSTKFMEGFTKTIFNPKMKVIIVVNFLVLAGLCAWSASLFTQEFSFADALPDDSYVTSFVNAFKAYQDTEYVTAQVVFRDADFSDPSVRDQMERFVEDLVGMDCVTNEPTSFWLRDFNNFTSTTDLSNLTFDEQLQTFLSTGNYSNVHRGNMAFAANGTLISSRCYIEMDKVDDDVVKTQVDAFAEQWHVTLAQPINHGKARKAFFTYSENNYETWAFYTRSVKELRNSAIVGIFSVTVVALLFIPHWTAAIFVCPVVCLMYLDILGILQWANIHINPVTFVSLVMSIGLIVDYILHILLRYYETPGNSRQEKITGALITMGVSVFAGGFSTFLGTLPLAFSVTQIFWIIFMSFLVLVTVALAHALIFLPVILALLGPQDNILAKHGQTYVQQG